MLSGHLELVSVTFLHSLKFSLFVKSGTSIRGCLEEKFSQHVDGADCRAALLISSQISRKSYSLLEYGAELSTEIPGA